MFSDVTLSNGELVQYLLNLRSNNLVPNIGHGSRSCCRNLSLSLKKRGTTVDQHIIMLLEGSKQNLHLEQ